MDLRSLALGAPWMSKDERVLANGLVYDLRKLFRMRGVIDTPLITLRVEDLCVSWLLAKRAEEALPPKDSGERAAAAAIEFAGRVRERLRKAVKELEEACAKMGTPVDIGIADRMKPLLKRTAGVIEETAARVPEGRSSDRSDPGDPADSCTE